MKKDKDESERGNNDVMKEDKNKERRWKKIKMLVKEEITM